jgi:hypothetical protein
VQACATAGLALWSDGRQVLPALGLAWSSCVGQRLFLARTGRPDGAGGSLRQLRVVYSPFLPQVAPGCGQLRCPGSQPPPRGHCGTPAGHMFAGLASSKCLPPSGNLDGVVQRDCHYLVEKAGIRGVRNQDVQGQGAGAGSTPAGAAAIAQDGRVGGTAAMPAGPAVAGAPPAHAGTDSRTPAAAEVPHEQQSVAGARSPNPGAASSWQSLPGVQQHAAVDVWHCGEAAAVHGNDPTGPHARMAFERSHSVAQTN